jgi:hypothetical protein
MTVAALKMLYDINHYAITVNLAGLTHNDSLLLPAGGGNCLNWVLGHILVSRNRILALLGEPPALNHEIGERYQRGSKPITQAAEAHSLEMLVNAFNESQQALMAALDRLDETRLCQPAGEKTLGEHLPAVPPRLPLSRHLSGELELRLSVLARLS